MPLQHMYQGKNISKLLTSYRFEALRMGQTSVLLIGQIIMKFCQTILQAMCNIHSEKKVTITTAIVGLEEVEKTVRKSLTKTFPNPTDQKIFDIMQTKDIPIKPLDDPLVK
ncbi:13447_t:CDS:2, partial [Funneliformis geosporum]